MRNRRQLGVALTVAAACAATIGCGGSELTASSSCQSFLGASEQEQNEAVFRLAGELHAPNAATPLGRPNINYLCAGNVNLTLGEAVSHTG